MCHPLSIRVPPLSESSRTAVPQLVRASSFAAAHLRYALPNRCTSPNDVGRVPRPLRVFENGRAIIMAPSVCHRCSASSLIAVSYHVHASSLNRTNPGDGEFRGRSYLRCQQYICRKILKHRDSGIRVRTQLCKGFDCVDS